ncbi:MAG TPA: porin [Candidatus Thiothrix moscowensis]|uniref:porin n=1 Tax=unclassified Thiothrix TaxID=2636184 RepID=UPI0025F51A41|nr:MULTISPECIES: porin [unclassified Thiothrix]HRJ52691.1 porin [Candidatus Thiothrix moscowensis]HRJ92825.1 porin [Candidatus Thiothrix moscowensis]
MHKNQIVLAVTLALVATAMPYAHAATWQAGDWELGLGGNVNTFYTVTNCDSSKLGAGGGTYAGLACLDPDTGAIASGDTHSVSNGLLPASLNFSAKTKQNGYDISGNVNVYYGTATQDANGLPGDALDFSTVDARQVYLTFGNEKMGTVKAGRDFGLFGFDPIINDMSLSGNGATFASAGPGHTTLGGLGYGYVYTDRLSQINWTTPKKNGVEATVGVFNPVDGVESNGSSTGDGGQPGVHGRVSYDWDKGNGVKGRVSVSALNQKVKLANGNKPSINGAEIFGKVDVNKASFAASYYQGKGMDSLGLGGVVFPGFDSASGQAEKTKGGMVQATYKVGKTKLGVNLAQSKQTNLTKVKNDKVTVGAYHNLTDNLTLIGEVSQQKSNLDGVGTDKSGSVAVGAMLSF